MSFIYNDLIDYKDTSVADPFRKLRVSNTNGIFNSTMQNDNNPEEWETVIATGGTFTYNSVDSSGDLNVTTSNGSRLLRQTLETFHYQAGSGMLIYMTGVLNNTQTGTASRIGIFDDENGMFFESKDGDFNVVLRQTLTLATLTEIRVAQSSFNKDKMDGTGPSGYNIDLTKSQLFSIDFAWLGVGRIRMSIWTGHCFCVCHEFILNNTYNGPYMGKGDLPLRYEIVNSQAVASTATMKQMCSAVFVEGSLNKTGYIRSVLTPANDTYAIPNTTNFYSLLTIRVRANQNRVVVQPKSYHVVVDGADTIHAAIIKDPIFTTTPSWINVDDYVEYSQTNSVVTPGIILSSTVVAEKSVGEIDLQIVRDFISTDYAGTSKTFCLAVRRINGGADVAGSFNFVEFR
jgi:hypothetical protein